MRAGEFARRRARIESEVRPGLNRHGKTFRRKAMRALIKRAGAAWVMPNGRHIGFRLPDGSVACEKHRFRDEGTAAAELARIASHASHAYIPVRTYCCGWCGGWHLTSRR